LKLNKTTLAEYLARWLKDYVQPNLSPKTAEGYEHIIHRQVMPAFGGMTLTQLKPEHLQKYYAEKLTRGLSTQTVRHHHTVLHKALQTEVEWGILSRNVADQNPPSISLRQRFLGVEEPSYARTVSPLVVAQ